MDLSSVFAAAFSGIYDDGTLHATTITYATNGDATPSATDADIKVQRDKATQAMRLDPGYTGTDAALYVLREYDGAAVTEPTTDDEITHDGVIWGIGSVESDPAKTHWICRGIRLRRAP